MIYTVSLNPGIDLFAPAYSMEYSKTNRTHDEYIVPGGKGLNVSVMLSKFGEETTAFGFASGFTGAELIRMMEELNVKCDFIDAHQGFTRINVKIVCGEVTEYNGSGISLTEEHIQEMLKKVALVGEDDFLVLSGSIPKGGSSDLYARFAAEMQKNGKGGKLIADTFGPALTEVLPYHPFLIKPNIDELSDLMGRTLTTKEEITEGARKLQEMGAVNVMVSLGGDGAMLLTEQGDVWFEETPKVPEGLTLNTVAAGDSMIGGFIHAYLQTGDYRKALHFSVATGTAAAYSRWIPEPEFIETLL